MEYLLEHLEDWKVFYDEVTEDMVEKAASQCGRSRGHASPGRRRLSRTADQLDTSRRQTRGDSVPGHVRAFTQSRGCPACLECRKLGTITVTTSDELGPKEQLVWVLDAKMGRVSYFERWYRGPRPREPCDQQLTKTMEGPTVTGKAHGESEFREWVRSRMARPASTSSEVERYMRKEPQETENPVDWWLAQQTTFPMLSKLTLDILAIPAMSSDCERTFSLAKLSLTSQRLSMSPATLEALQCLKNWTRQSAAGLGAVKWCQGWQDSGLVDLSDGEY
ncbi:hypothetical protein VFPBJ_11615 [Purpureocillium lilacinum]|uniref:HAT C-terminal dimerisation domain-containing protein n=1 Tax=Purpureocillium lilacinum TaxID=33203 RepID=A0A179F2E9_PURLI|nr:hypothetical protein VFPBJ_11615 [Purpureocillium lilacinum]